MKNKEIRDEIAKSGLKHWEVADAIGISPVTLCVWLRHELTGDRLTRVRGAIRMLLSEKEGDPVCS